MKTAAQNASLCGRGLYGRTLRQLPGRRFKPVNYRDIIFMPTLCMTQIVPKIRNAAASTV
jgi:hypothetical protein